MVHIKSETETVIKKILPYLNRRGYDTVKDFDFWESPKPLFFRLKILPELFRKVLAFIRFDDYNYTVIL